MPAGPDSHHAYLEFLRSRWPTRTRLLATHALAGSLVFVVLDWTFTRRQPAPPTLLDLALLRLPWMIIPIVGDQLARRAPRWRLLPHAVVALSVAWAWGSVGGYYLIGLEGSVLQAITLFACLVTAAALLPLTRGGRAGLFALMSLGYVAMDLLWSHGAPLEARLADDAVVLAFAVIQIFIFQKFAAAQQRGVLLRRTLERTVVELEASRRRAGAAVTEVGRLAAEVAHQVNNPLAAVKVNVRWLASDGLQPEHAAERTEVMVDSLQAVDRIALIVQDLKQRAAAQDEIVHREESTTSARLLQDKES
jgi:signal transduction histidine kinase